MLGLLSEAANRQHSRCGGPQKSTAQQSPLCGAPWRRKDAQSPGGALARLVIILSIPTCMHLQV